MFLVGAAAGATTVLRPLIVVQLVGAGPFAATNGRIQRASTIARAAAPLLLGVAATTVGWPIAWAGCLAAVRRGRRTLRRTRSNHPPLSLAEGTDAAPSRADAHRVADRNRRCVFTGEPSSREGQLAMKLGLGLPHLGPLASPAAIRNVATAAEAAGLDSLWAMDRLLSPISPRTLAYPGRSDGALPAAQQTVIDPLVALTIAATVTERVTVGTDVLVAPWYAPVLLARSLAALDQASAGRLVVGLGLGWSLDEFEAVGVPMSGRGQRIEEVLDVLDAVWRDDTIDLSTSHERIAPSVMGAKPVQRPRPPLLLGGRSRVALERIARRADGWLPFGIPLDEIQQSWAPGPRDRRASGT